MASLMIPSATPTLKSPRVVLTIYLASLGFADDMSSETRLNFLSCDPLPSISASFCRFSKTFSTVRNFAKRVLCFFFSASSCITNPKSPVFLNLERTSFSENPVDLETIFTIRRSAIPISFSLHEGKTFPCRRSVTFESISFGVSLISFAIISIFLSLAEVFSRCS